MKILTFSKNGLRRWFDFWDRKNSEEDFSLVKILSTFLIVLGIYFISRIVLYRITLLSHDSYFEKILYWEFLKKITAIWPLGLTLLLIGVVLNKRLLLSWSVFEKGHIVRNLMLFFCVILVWDFSFYEYNWYFDQTHLADRILLLLLVPATYFRPFFLIPFLSLALVIIGQFEVLPVYSIANPEMFLQLILLFICFFIFKILTKKFRFVNFIFLFGCVMATNYIFSGAGKLFKEDWLFYDQINYVMISSYANGWANFLSLEEIEKITTLLGNLNIPLKLFTLFVECGFLFFFLRLKWTRVLLSSAIALHIGIFIFTGIFFWSWILLHTALLFFVLKEKVFEETKIFNTRYLLLSMPIILSGLLWNQPVYLVWYDIPFGYSHRYIAETEAGKSYSLSSDFFHPYDYQFTLTRFSYLDKKTRLGTSNGATSRHQIFNFFKEDRTLEELSEFEKSMGSIHYSEDKKVFLENFIKKFVQNKNEAQDKNVGYLSVLKTPDLLWVSKKEEGQVNENEKIAKIIITNSTGYYTESKGYKMIVTDTISSIKIE